MEDNIKKFKMVTFGGEFGYQPEYFDEGTSPHWLKYGGREGSTMDNRWFWDNHVMTLKVGECVETAFQTITRIE